MQSDGDRNAEAVENTLGSSIGEFVGRNENYYVREFGKIQSATELPRSWNGMAALAGPFWGAARGLWGYFWTFLMLELLALVQLGRGLWGELGADKIARAEKLNARYQELYAKAKQGLQAGEADAQGLITTAGNLKRAAERVLVEGSGGRGRRSQTHHHRCNHAVGTAAFSRLLRQLAVRETIPDLAGGTQNPIRGSAEHGSVFRRCCGSPSCP